MNHMASQLRFTFSRSQGVGARGAGLGLLMARSVIGRSTLKACHLSPPGREVNSRSGPLPADAASALLRAIDSLQLPLCIAYGRLDVIFAGAEAGKHVEDDIVRNRGRRLLAVGAEAAGRKRALGHVTKRRALRILSPDRIGVECIEAVREIALRRQIG